MTPRCVGSDCNLARAAAVVTGAAGRAVGGRPVPTYRQAAAGDPAGPVWPPAVPPISPWTAGVGGSAVPACTKEPIRRGDLPAAAGRVGGRARSVTGR